MRTVLIVDDEPSILRVASLALERRYRVLTALSGQDALGLLEQDPIDVLLTDHRMPGMTGVELIRTCRERWPQVSCLLSTGFATDAVLKEAVQSLDVARILHKPWNLKELREALDDVVGNGA